MNQRIIIESPCDASWDKMSKNNTGRHCDSCQTTVIDFSKMALEDIQLFFQNNSHQKICGRYHNRHTVTSNKWFELLNKIEDKFIRTKFKKLGLGLIYVLLLLSSCKTKKKNTQETMGRYLYNKSARASETSLAKK